MWLISERTPDQKEERGNTVGSHFVKVTPGKPPALGDGDGQSGPWTLGNFSVCVRVHVKLDAASYRLPAELTATERPSPCLRLILRSQPRHGQACGPPGTPQPAEASPSPHRPCTLTGGLCGRISGGQQTGNCPRGGLRSPQRRQRPLPETAGLPGGQGAPSHPRDATGQQPWEAAAPARHLREDPPRARWSLRAPGPPLGPPDLGPRVASGQLVGVRLPACGFLRVQGRPAHHALLSRVLTRCAHPGTGAEGALNAHTRQVSATPQLGTLGLPGLFTQGRPGPSTGADARGRSVLGAEPGARGVLGGGGGGAVRLVSSPPGPWRWHGGAGAERSRRKPGGHPRSIPAASGTRGRPCIQEPEDLCCTPFYC